MNLRHAAISSADDGATISTYVPVKNVDHTIRVSEEESDSSSSDKQKIMPRSAPLIRNEEVTFTLMEVIKQKWNGTVVAFNENELEVRLEDLTNPDSPEEFMTLSRDEIDPQEQLLIKQGAMFSWYIGYRLGPKYPKERFSKILFRRLPNWTCYEIQEAKTLAKEYSDFFQRDSSSAS